MLTLSRRWCILHRARRFSTAAADVDKSTFRLVRIHGLPTGYNLSEVVRAAGCAPIQQVIPAENHVCLRFYSWTQAVACARHPIKLEGDGEGGRGYPVELDKTQSGDGGLVGADVVARLGALHAHRSLEVYFDAGTQALTAQNIEQGLAAAGPLEFCRPFRTNGGRVGANIAFLDEKDAFYYSTLRKAIPGFKWATCAFMSFFPKKIAKLRRVCITEVPTEDAAALAEQVEAIPVTKAPLGECITYMGHARDTMTIDFRHPYQAAHFYRRFPAHVDGLTLRITPMQTTDYPMSLAMNAGAGRTVRLHLDAPTATTTTTLASLQRHFEDFGAFDAKIDENNRVLLRFHSVYSACKAVHRMTQGDHGLPPKYTGVLVSFAVRERDCIQRTRPVPIKATVFGWKKPYSWTLLE